MVGTWQMIFRRPPPFFYVLVRFWLSVLAGTVRTEASVIFLSVGMYLHLYCFFKHAGSTAVKFSFHNCFFCTVFCKLS